MTPVVRSLREALLTFAALLATLACGQWLAPGAASAVLAGVLALSLARSHLAGERDGRLEALVALPLVSLASVGVGGLLRHAPWAGAALFVAAMSASIWMRRFGPLGRRAGSLFALPLVTLLVVPHLSQEDGGAVARVLVPVAIAVAALAWVTVAEALGRRIGWIAPAPPASAEDEGPRATAGGTLRPPAHTRMALQMAAALAASFVIGELVFPAHWGWIVLTAFIVNSGNRGRQDVVYKSALRVLGAAAGTVAAVALSGTASLRGAPAAALILGCVFLGVWLRPLGYGWWALFVTLALALLQGLQPHGEAPLALLAQRLVEIAIGAVLGVAAAWFVFPIRSTDVLRRRIADALAAMAEALDPGNADRRPERIAATIAQVEQLRPSFHARRLALGRWRPQQPVEWIDALAACREPAMVLAANGGAPSGVRRAIGAARKAMRHSGEIGAALEALRQALEQGSDGSGLRGPFAQKPTPSGRDRAGATACQRRLWRSLIR